MSRYSVQEFVQAHGQQDKSEGVFELERDRLLEVNLDGKVWTKMGSMVAYTGQIKFIREGLLEHGVATMMKRFVTGEGAPLTKAEGKGKLYLADCGKKISILNLATDAICVNGNDLLAFESSVSWDIQMMRKVAGMLAGGLFNVRLNGPGLVAITTHYDPLVLRVRGAPVYTDPNATVGWSATLAPELVADVSLKTFLGRASGESLQMEFRGAGFVIVQPYEEVYSPHRPPAAS